MNILNISCEIARKWMSHGLINSSSPSAANASVNQVSIGSDNGLSPIRRQAII